jgi:hypothetical protein
MDVVRNRVKSPDFPNSHCDVVKQESPVVQFSWYRVLKPIIGSDPMVWSDLIYQKYNPFPLEIAAWDKAYDYALSHYYDDPPDESKGSIYYMTLMAFIELKRSNIIVDYTVSVVEGEHVFFSYIKWRGQ